MNVRTYRIMAIRKIGFLGIYVFLLAFCLYPVACKAADTIAGQTLDVSDPFNTGVGLDSKSIAARDFNDRCVSSVPDFHSLSLIESIDASLCNNAKVRRSWATVKAQAASLGVVKSGFLPVLSASIGHQVDNSSYAAQSTGPVSHVANTAAASLSLRLFDFGTRSADRESASSLLVAAIHARDAVLLQTLDDVVRAYFDGQSARSNMVAKAEGREIASATLRSATRREELGTIAHSDVLQATTAYARAALEYNRAAGEFHKTLSMLKYLMGMDSNVEIDLADGDVNIGEVSPELALRRRGALENLLSVAKINHPSILALRAEVDAARSSVKSAKAAGLPTIDFTYNYYKNAYPNQGLASGGLRTATAGVVISFPIFSGFSTKYKIRQMEAVVEQKDEELADKERDVATGIVRSFSDAKAALENLDATSILLKAATESLASSKRRYDKGASGILEVLSSQRELEDAKYERVRAIADWRASRFRVMTAAGRFERSYLELLTR